MSGWPDFRRESFTLGAGRAITLAAPVSRLRVRAGEVEVNDGGVLARVPAGRAYEPSGAIVKVRALDRDDQRLGAAFAQHAPDPAPEHRRRGCSAVWSGTSGRVPGRVRRANVYIDGFNLFYGALKGRPHLKWLDLAALGRALLLPDQSLHRVRYFTARVGGRGVDHKLPQRQDTFLRAVATLPGVSVHEGYFQTKPTRLPLASSPAHAPEIVEVLRTEEKGSDVNLATYLLLDAFREDAEVAVVVSDDFDLKEPLRVTRHVLGRTLGVASPRGRPSLSRAAGASFYRPVRDAMLRECQLPATVEVDGGSISRPADWS